MACGPMPDNFPYRDERKRWEREWRERRGYPPSPSSPPVSPWRDFAGGLLLWAALLLAVRILAVAF